MTELAPKVRPRSALREFLTKEAAGGILLMGAAACALLMANSPLARTYHNLLHHAVGPVSVHLVINDGLMAVFFLLVGLEIKRELLDGHLVSWADRRLPVIAAIGGMVVPALVYLTLTTSSPALARGWAIPAATDIAFAIGVIALLGARVPASLKLLLTTIAIVDDMGAVAIIALVYSDTINALALAAAALIWLGMMGLNRLGVTRLWPYLLLSVLLWGAVLFSGVHATIAGVLAAFAIPFRRTIAAPDAEDSTLHRLEHGLNPWVAFFIVPLFGFANAGVSFAGTGWESVTGALPMGIALGLFIGKQVGIFGSIRLAVALKIAARPAHARWLQVYGMALLCGIGFTMSLFIGGLAFHSAEYGDAVKIGVLLGSLGSAVAGSLLLGVSAKASGPAD
jgi:Na+:H+ antiporter, NhaA family